MKIFALCTLLALATTLTSTETTDDSTRLAAATWINWSAGPRTLSDALSLVHIGDDDRHVSLIDDVNPLQEATLPEFSGTWWQGVAVICEVFNLRPMPAVNYYAHEQIEGCVISGGNLQLGQADQQELLQAWFPYAPPHIAPAGPIAMLIGSRVDWQLPDQSTHTLVAFRLRLEPHLAPGPQAKLVMYLQDEAGNQIAPPALKSDRKTERDDDDFAEFERDINRFQRPNNFRLQGWPPIRGQPQAPKAQEPQGIFNNLHYTPWTIWSWSPAIPGPIAFQGQLEWPQLQGKKREWLMARQMSAKPINGDGVEIHLRNTGAGSTVQCDIHLPPNAQKPQARLLKRNKNPYPTVVVNESSQSIRLEARTQAKTVVIVELSWQQKMGDLQANLRGLVPAKLD